MVKLCHIFQPKKSKSDVTRSSDLKVNDVGDKLFIRVERQTIRRLPISHAVIFQVEDKNQERDDLIP